MIKILLILFVLSYGYNSIAQKIENDKILHFSAGLIISNLAYIKTYEITKNKKKAFLISLGTNIVVGSLKEFIDKQTKSDGVFDTNDITATLLGGLTSNLTLTFILDNPERIKRKKDEEKINEMKLEEMALR
jgi:hypothetical protein